jgi:hypothetical protein
MLTMKIMTNGTLVKNRGLFKQLLLFESVSFGQVQIRFQDLKSHRRKVDELELGQFTDPRISDIRRKFFSIKNVKINHLIRFFYSASMAHNARASLFTRTRDGPSQNE